MYTYNVTQWLAFFFIYCFLGWCWESSYVSIKSRKLVNRGFIHGPLLPIYGSGAVVVLFVALPFQKNVVAVYFAGMIAATLLEYVTGVLMETLFKVRYWDYSKQFLNFQGHICLTSSLAWGFFSVGMVYWFHKPFEKAVLSVPENILSPVIYIVAMLAAADFALSFKTAIELRDVLVKLEKAKNEMRLMQKRLEVIEAVLADEALQKKEDLSAELAQKKEDLSAGLAQKKEDLSAGLAQKKEDLSTELSQIRERLGEITRKTTEKAYMTKDKLSMLRRNPGATSMKYGQALGDFRNEIWPEIKAEVIDKIGVKIEEKMEEKKEERRKNDKQNQ